MEVLHIPVGWHKTSHQWSGRELENNPSFFQVEIIGVIGYGLETGICQARALAVWKAGNYFNLLL